MLAEPLPYRVRAFAAEKDGELLGVGGFAFLPGGGVAAFVEAAPGAHRYRLAFHRAGLMAMREARRLGFTRIVATAETKHPRAEAWLARLGFHSEDVDGTKVWIWERS